MADYIDRSIICESYIFVENYHLDEEKKRQLESGLIDYAKTRAPLFFGSDIKIDAEAIEGSLKMKVTVVASLTNLFIFYGSLRQSVDYIYKDAQTIASAFVTESMFAAGVKSNQVGRTEVRTGVPGTLKRVISRIDALHASASTMPPEEFSAELAGVRCELERIIDMISSEEDKRTVAKGFVDILNVQYPKPTTPPQEEKGVVPAPVLCRDEIEEFLRKLTGAGTPPL